MTVEVGAPRRGLVERAKNILLTPKTEWDVVAAESATTQGLFTGYTMILALIPAVILLLGGLLASSMLSALGGFMGAGVGIHFSPVWIILDAVKNYAFLLLGVFLTALIINAFAPTFGAQKNAIQALKVSTYAATAFWVSALALIIPILGVLVVLAGVAYACYLIYLGLRQVMGAPEDKAVGYAAVSIIVSILACLLIALIVNIPLGLMRTASMFGGGPAAVTVNLPDGTRINVDEATNSLEKFGKEMEAAAANGEITVNGGTATDGSTLQGLLPAALPGGYTRTEVSSGGMAGVAMGAEAVYTKGASRIELNVVDSGALGALAGMAGGMQSNKTTATGYEKMGQVNGRLTTEEFDRSNNSGKYGVIVGRFLVEAEGSGVSIPELKAAVEAVPFARLEALAK